MLCCGTATKVEMVNDRTDKTKTTTKQMCGVWGQSYVDNYRQMPVYKLNYINEAVLVQEAVVDGYFEFTCNLPLIATEGAKE